MSILDLSKLTAGLSGTWASLLRDWDRSLRAGNYPATTRYNYLLAAAQLGRYLAEYSPDPDADDAAADPAAVTRAHVEAFQAWMIDTRSAATAVNKHKGLQQFFRWLAARRAGDRPLADGSRSDAQDADQADPGAAGGGDRPTARAVQGQGLRPPAG